MKQYAADTALNRVEKREELGKGVTNGNGRRAFYDQAGGLEGQRQGTLLKLAGLGP